MKTSAASIKRGRGNVSHQGPTHRLLDNLVDKIGLRILGGDYAPIEALPIEPNLMLEFGVSRTVLREAVKILTAKGLVESRGKLGTRVRERRYWNLLDPTILHLYCQVVEYSTFAESFQQIRTIIEPEAAALAAEHHSGKQLKALEDAYHAMEAAKSIEEWTTTDLSFHEAILEATGNPFMRPLGALISTALETLLFHSAKSSANPFDSLVAHGRVLDAIRGRDVGKAREAMKTLLTGTALSLSKTIRMERRQRVAGTHSVVGMR
jgi:DNA-binding FadR family transcriptional regulator